MFLGFGEKQTSKGWRYVVARLGEASTLRGCLMLLTAAGVRLRGPSERLRLAAAQRKARAAA